MRCVGYVRLSLVREGEEPFSPDRQLAEIRGFAGARAWEFVGEYRDVGESAYRKGLERPALKRLLADAERGEFEVVCAYSISRLARSTLDFWKLVQELESRGVLVATVADQVDLTTPAGKLMTTVIAALAELESAQIGERVKSAHRVKAEAGKFPSGGPHRHWGYERDGRVVRDEARFVKAAVKRIASGESVRSTASWLNEQGSRTTTGKEWIGQALLASLSDGRVAGLRRLDGQIYEGDWKPIVTREQWQQMMSVLQDRHRPRTKREPALLGAGLVRCAECGSGMYLLKTGSKGAWTYSCTKRGRGKGCGSVSVARERLEEFVVERFVNEMPAVMAALSEARAIEDIEADAADVERRLTALSEARYVDEAITDAEFRAARTRLIDEARVIEGELVAARESLVGVDLREAWSDADSEGQRALLRKAVARVVVSKATKRGGRFDPARARIDWRWTTLMTAAEEPDEADEDSAEEYRTLGREGL